MVLTYKNTESSFSNADDLLQLAIHEQSLLETLEALGGDVLNLLHNPASLSLTVKLNQ